MAKKAKGKKTVKAIFHEDLSKEVINVVVGKIFKDVGVAFKASSEKKRVKTLNEAKTLINALKNGDTRLIDALV